MRRSVAEAYARCLARLECYADSNHILSRREFSGTRSNGWIRASSPMETRLSAQAFAWQEKLDERKKTHGELPSVDPRASASRASSRQATIE